ncbi:MAG: hypothetical protein HUJ86_04575, partial [Synergistes sp.]|nr:hypothetical protein [Synergistes sp.]
MADNKVKISQLPESKQTRGLYTIGVDNSDNSVKVAIGDIIEDAKEWAAKAEEIVTEIDEKLEKKVDKVDGKGLSTNDYTDADKEIVGGVQAKLDEKLNISDVLNEAGESTTKPLSQKATCDAVAAVVDATTEVIGQEAQARAAGDAALTDALHEETNQRQRADSVLQQTISGEAAARQQADNALQLALNGKLAKINHNDKAYTA